MDQSYSESDISLSPTQILDRLQLLRQMQLLQRGKLQKQHSQYQDTSETSSSITEIVSQFSNSSSYNTLRSLLQSSQNPSTEVTPRLNASLTDKVKELNLIEGISVLNLSQESEFVLSSPLSTRSRASVPSRTEQKQRDSPSNGSESDKKQISLEEMPILSPKHDFEALVLEKLNNENFTKEKKVKKVVSTHNKKSFLKKGEGMARFGLKKRDLVIQNTQSLPWKRKMFVTKALQSSVNQNTVKKFKDHEKVDVEVMVHDPKIDVVLNKNGESVTNQQKIMDSSPKLCPPPSQIMTKGSQSSNTVKLPVTADLTKQNEVHKTTEPPSQGDLQIIDSSNCDIHKEKPHTIQLPKGKHPLIANKGKTWAAVLTKEQDDFLRQLKQSEYYKNFVSPAKSIQSDMSTDDNLYKLRQDREKAEQNMFELLENKVCNESFHLENSFFSRFLKRSSLECSGESTPLIMQKCLANNPKLMHIIPDLAHKETNETNGETCDSEYTDCSDTCSSACSCCSCKTLEANETTQSYNERPIKKNNVVQKVQIKTPTNEMNIKQNKNMPEMKIQDCHDDTITGDDTLKVNMAEMNAKLTATSELLKERLRELEDEIETFRKENSELAKMREEVDLERQKFYEEKNAFEQKYNEDKILAEYYLAEEKEKLSKQKQIYEKYVREMRGRLNKKEKDEVINLKKSINELKEEIRVKDAKSTSTIARLRNQLKIMEKEKKDLQDEVEKLKKENRRIQHGNEITRRLTNMKYLEEINKKLSRMSKGSKSDIELDDDVKYKAFEIERQSRSRKKLPENKPLRQRAKSVPNLKVTSRYAKYFSQRDNVSDMEKNTDEINRLAYTPLDDEGHDANTVVNLDDTMSIENNEEDPSENEDCNNLEKIYLERFRSTSPVSSRSSLSNAECSVNAVKDNPDNFFIRKSSNNSRDRKPNDSLSPHYSGSNSNKSKSPISILSYRSNSHPDIENGAEYSRKSKSHISTQSAHSSSSHIYPTVINQEMYTEKLRNLSPEPSSSKTSLTKTNLNPTEIKKPDGSRELRYPNGNVKYISADGKYSKFVYYNGDVKENFYDEGRIKYFYAEAKTYHTTHPDGLEVLEFPDGQVEKRYKDGSTEIRLPNGSVRYYDPKNVHVREEWRFPDGTALTVSADGEKRIVFPNAQIEVHSTDHKRREFPDGTVKLVYHDGTSETRYASGRVRIKDKHGNLIMDSAPQ